MKISEFRKILKAIDECTPAQKKARIHGVHLRVNGDRCQLRSELKAAGVSISEVV